MQTVCVNVLIRFKIMVRKCITFLCNSTSDLNIFPARFFGSNTDRATAKRLGQWATRLYIVLFISSLVILALYTFIQSKTLTKTFDKPSFSLYNQLYEEHGNNLKCSCSIIASPYNQFLQIEAVFHQVRKYVYLTAHVVFDPIVYRFVQVHSLRMKN